MSHGMLLTVQNLTTTLAGKRLFTSLSFTVNRQQVVSLIGPNGAGKTTLLRLIDGVTGSAERANDCVPDGLEDDLVVGGTISVAPYSMTAMLDQRITPRHLRQYGRGIDSDKHLRKIVAAFGLEFTTGDLESMSAGMLQKLGIARLFARKADFYMLDEPSNYLDLPGIVALEHYILQLKRQGSGFLIVTHDRYLSDRVSDRTIYLAHEDIYQSEGGASAALALMEIEVQARRHRAASLRRKIDQLEKDVIAKAGWAQQKEKSIRGAGSSKGFISHRSAKMARRAKAVQQRIERQRRQMEEAKPFIPKRVKLSLPQRKIPHRSVFRLEECSFRYAAYTAFDTWILEKATIGASTSDKICLMGANGAGKSTLLRLASGELEPTEGTAYRNVNVKIGNLPQGLVDYFARQRLLDNFIFPGMSESSVRQYLGAALLRREMALQNIDELSQGELMRAALVHAILAEVDFLILDEPTSHLDLESVMVLENLLSTFTGGFLLVSHDRAFASNVADSLYYLEHGRLTIA